MSNNVQTLTIRSLAHAERFVTEQQALNNDVRWDGWDMVFFRQSPKGVYSKDGAYRKGEWGFENRTRLTDAGTWEVDFRNVRRAKSSARS